MQSNSDLNDYFLTPKEVAELFDITVQGFHKICQTNGILTQQDSKSHKIYPAQLNKLLAIRNGGMPFPRAKRRMSIHSVKGGPGKTTLAHVISTRASAYGWRTLVIDLDKQANLTNSFGFNDESEDVETALTLYEKVNSKGPINAKFSIVEITDYLSLLQSNISMANFDLALQSNTANLPKLFKRMLAEVEKEYDLILFDLPPDFNRVTIAAHCFSDTCLIPVNMNAFSLKGIKLTYDHLEYLEDEFGVKLHKKIILNKIDSRNTSAYEIISALSDQFGDEVCKTIIPISKALEDSFLKKRCVWKTTRAKPALDSLDGIVCHLLGIDGWKNSLTTKKTNPVRRTGNEQRI